MTTFEASEQVTTAASYILKKLNVESFQAGIVLGSGLGSFPVVLENKIELPYGEIPFFPQPTVVGHAGKLICGSYKGVSVLCFSGRVHSYEGIPWAHVCFQVQLMSALGVKLYVITNAAGGITKGMRVGDLLLIRDHMRFTARVDPTSFFIPIEKGKQQSQIDLHNDYWSENLANLMEKVSEQRKIRLLNGVYNWCSGPCYETPLEVLTMQKICGGNVGMSTVPEALMARHLGIRVVGISMVTNLAAGISNEKLSHEEVFLNAKNAQAGFNELIAEFIYDSFNGSSEAQNYFLEPKLPKLRSDINYDPAIFSSNFSSENIQAAGTTIRSLAQTGLIERVVVTNVVDAKLGAKYLTTLDALQGFPVSSNDGANSKLHFVNDTLFIEVNMKPLYSEGFSVAESTYLALLLNHLNVQSAVVVVPSEEAQTKPLTDIVHFTGQTRPLMYLYNMIPFAKTSASQWTNRSESLKGEVYTAFGGPSQPSEQEKRESAYFGATTQGTYLPALVYTLRFVDIPVQTLIGSSFSTETSALLQAPAGRRSPVAVHYSAPVLNKKPLVTYETVDEAATWIKASFDGLGLETVKTVLIDIDLNLPLDDFEVLGDVLLRYVPHFMETLYTKAAGDAKLYLLKSKQTQSTLLYFKLGSSCTDPGYINDCTFVTRIAHHIPSVEKLVYLSVTMPAHSVATGTICLNSDHINLTGENPMTGHNEEKWGPRFYDMTDTYSKSFNESFQEKCKESKIVQCLFHDGRNFAEYSEALRTRFAENAGIGVMSATGAREVLVARHYDHQTKHFQIGFVSIAADFNDEQSGAYAQKKQTIASTLQQIL